MSRQEVLVDADWVAEHGSDSNVVLVEVDEEASTPPAGPPSGRRAGRGCW